MALIANSKRSAWRVVLWMMGSLFAASVCAQPAVAPTPESPPADFTTQSSYRIGAGDMLQIFVWRQPELSVSVQVRPDGRITTPLIDDLMAVGKTPTELAGEMERALAAYLRAPRVNVIVTEFVGLTSAQIRVTGEATNPQAVPYRNGLTLLDVVIAVGGLTEFAAGNRSHVVRTTGSETNEIRVRLDDLMKRGKVENNIEMQPGDILIIPQRVF